MTRRAVIAGRVTNEFGDPMQMAQITTESTTPDSSTPLISLDPLSATTDDRGEFSMSGAPGRYFVRVEPFDSNRHNGGAREVRTDGTQPSTYGVTWFPSAESRDHAAVVETFAGRDTTGIDIRLRPRRFVSISGVVSARPNGNQNAVVRIWSDEAGMRMAGVGPDGSFISPSMPQGDYHVQARFDGIPAMRSALVNVNATGGDLGGLQLTLTLGEELAGTVEVASQPSGVKRTVTLKPVSGAPRGLERSAAAPINADGAFRLTSVYPGKYVVKVTPIPDNAYIKSDRVVDLTRGVGSAKLKIIVSLNGATVTGSVVDEKGEPPSLPLVFAVLAKTPEDESRILSKVVISGSNYSLTGVPPGKYRLYAVDAGSLGNPEAMKALFATGDAIDIHEGDRIEKNAKLLEDN